MTTRVRQEGDRVWLEGVSGWFFGDRGSSVHAAQEAVMHALGEDVTYEYLLGVSGLAFRMQVSTGGLCPSSPHSFCGYRCVARSTQSLPWKVKIFEVKPEQVQRVAEARRAIVDSIHRGVPVQYGEEEDGIIVGYQNNGEEWICYHPLRDAGKKTFIETGWPWGIAVYPARKTEMPNRRELALGALQQAVKMAVAKEADGYALGFNAWDEYVHRLAALEEADDRARKDALVGNAWIYKCLVDYRACAAQYLRGVAGDFADQAAEHLKGAANRYDKMSRQVLSDEAHGAAAIAPFPWTLKEGRLWTTDMRQEQIRRLQDALPLEREAIAEIEGALGRGGTGSRLTPGN